MLTNIGILMISIAEESALSTESIGGALKKAWDWIVSAIKSIIVGIASFFKGIWKWVTGVFSKKVKELKKNEPKIKKAIAEKGETVHRKFYGLNKAIVSGAIAAVAGLMSKLVNSTHKIETEVASNKTGDSPSGNIDDVKTTPNPYKAGIDDWKNVMRMIGQNSINK